MISARRTRVIVDGKIVPNIDEVKIIIPPNKDTLVVYLSQAYGNPVEHKLLGIDVVEEKKNFKDETGETWIQFICESVGETKMPHLNIDDWGRKGRYEE